MKAEIMAEDEPQSWADLGLIEELSKECIKLNWIDPTPIQRKTIKHIFLGRNLVALAETGSGKTGAYVLPILQSLIDAQTHYYAVILVPTRELAVQVQNQFMALGKVFGLNSVLLVGGIPIGEQSKQMRLKTPHVIVATPGRFIDHIKKTKGFDELKLKNVKYLVIDEADRLMGHDFINVLERVITILPRTRQTMLYSATMTSKVNKLTKAAVRDPVKISTRTSKFQSLSKLRQFVYLVPQCDIDMYLVYILRLALSNEISSELGNLKYLKLSSGDDENPDDSIIVFTRTRDTSNRLTLLLRQFIPSNVIPLNGDMAQAQRLSTLDRFKKISGSVLVATDIASRGLDIPEVGLVVNYDVPLEPKTYMHRIGRTARAGRSGCALTLLTQNSICFYLDEIESHLLESDGTTQMKVPSIVDPGSEADKLLEENVERISLEVKEAASQANLTLDKLKKNKKNLQNSYTSVADVKAPAKNEIILKAGMKRSMWASEAPPSRQKEIRAVLDATCVEEPPEGAITSKQGNKRKKGYKKRFKEIKNKKQ